MNKTIMSNDTKMPSRKDFGSFFHFSSKLKLFTAFFVLCGTLFAQESASIEMADEMRATGKIYVVITVLSIVFLGIVLYLISLDRKISKLEKEIQNKS